MIAARVTQGVGMSMFPIAFAIIREVLPERKLAIGQTIFGSTLTGGGVVGLVVGAAIIQNFGWQVLFLAIFPVAAALWLLIVRFVRVGNPAPVEKSITRSGGDNISNVKKIDIKGTLALAATIISFLAGISQLGTESVGSYFLLAGLFATSAASLAAFVAIERRAKLPLIDIKLMTSKQFLPPVVILMIVSMSIFMVYQTIPVMVRSPAPLGFGGDAVAVASVQLPFMIVLLIGTIMSGFILNKIKNTKLTLIGTVISAIGFFILFMFHSTEYAVSLGLAIISAGLALSIAGAFNTILLSVPMQMTGIAVGMALLLQLVGMSVGPSLAGVFQQMNQGIVQGFPGFFPTENAYNLIFITAALVSLASVILALFVTKGKEREVATDPTGNR